MKKIDRLILRSFLLLLLLDFTTFSFAQIHIDNEKDISIGTTTTEACKLRIYNDDGNNKYGLSIANNASNATGVTGTRFGIYSGVRQDTAYTGNGRTTGIHSVISSYGTGKAYATASEVVGVGTGVKIAFWGIATQVSSSNENVFGADLTATNYGTGNVFGVRSNVTGGSGAASFGISNRTVGGSGGVSYGIKNDVIGGSGGASIGVNNKIVSGSGGGSYGIRNDISGGAGGVSYGIENLVKGNLNSTTTIAGIRNVTKLDGSSNFNYGIQNITTANDQSSYNRYGIYNKFIVEDDSTGVLGFRYALYSQVAGDNTANTYAGYFSGNVQVTGTFTHSSDRRLKENIKDFAGGLAVVQRLSPKTYDFKSNLSISLPKGKQYGLIAQDLENVLPALVKDTQHPTPITVRNVAQENSTEEGVAEALGGSTSYKSINYQALIPVLISAIQEQQVQIELQGEEIELLKKELSILKERR